MRMSSLQVIPSYRGQEGGFQIRRTFPSQHLSLLDPFLLLDYFGPMDVKPGEMPGVSDHPHRGFETVTYIIEGEVEHNDSKGNHGVIKPGGIQWMTAGSGIIHSEFPSNHLSKNGGVLKGFQLWVNLPSDKKMMDTNYQDLTADDLPVIKNSNYDLRVIGGEYEGVQSPASIHSPLFIGHVTLHPGEFEWKIPDGFNAGFVALDGEVEMKSYSGENKTVLESELGLISDETKVLLSSKKLANCVLLTGKPLNEPVARYGPFVMNTEGEIKQALLDYQMGLLR
jgi:hypothetical protein